jgi:hypothetical protein
MALMTGRILASPMLVPQIPWGGWTLNTPDSLSAQFIPNPTPWSRATNITSSSGVFGQNFNQRLFTRGRFPTFPKISSGQRQRRGGSGHVRYRFEILRGILNNMPSGIDI